MMNNSAAVKLAVKAILYYCEHRLNVNANLYLTGFISTPQLKASFEERQRFRKAIQVLMSINDPIVLYYNPKRKKFHLQQGRETFYDENDQMIEFDSRQEAGQYCMKEFGVLPIDDDGSFETDQPVNPRKKPQEGQLELL